MEKVVRVVVEGRVQGVWYRGWTVDEARSRNLSGWVRNRTDGTVEAVFAGAARDVDDMIARCRVGPPMARVDAVTAHPADPPAELGFRHLPTV